MLKHNDLYKSKSCNMEGIIILAFVCYGVKLYLFS
jgi:hypothetical protein